MSGALDLRIRGIGAFAPGIPDWPAVTAVARGERTPGTGASPIPPASALTATVRRRAPASVLLAAEVAAQACRMAGAALATLPCIFASSYGDPAITDYVCATLVRAPLDLSPTRFHNSVLNAPAGYWTIAAGCTAASSAVTAGRWSFTAGLLEAATIASAEATPVLFACCDIAAAGPLTEMIGTTLPFGAALVLDPAAHAGPRMRLAPAPGAADEPAITVPTLRAIARDNPANAHALALLVPLARRQAARLRLPLSSGLSLDMEITP